MTAGGRLLRVALAALLGLVAIEVGPMAHPAAGLSPKNATGCSLEEDTRPAPGGCRDAPSGNCYDCLHSDPYGIIECAESPDGTELYCRPFAN